MGLLRRARGILVTALLWAVGWTAIAWPVATYLLPRFSGMARLTTALRMASYAGVGGAVTGATFATLVVFLERRSTLATFSTRRAALWGATAGAFYAVLLILRGPAGTTESPIVFTAAAAIGAVIGGASAALMRRLAHRADAVSAASANARAVSPAT